MIPVVFMAALSTMPLSVKHVAVDQDRIIEFQCKIGWICEVDFPRNRTILDFHVGDEGFWDVSKRGNVLFVHPMDVPAVGGGGGQKTNISVSLDNGSYTLAVEEISKVKGASPNLKVIADMGAEETNSAPLVRPELYEAVKAENAALKQQLEQRGKGQAQACEEAVQREINSWRGGYELFDRKGKPELNPIITHDDVSTFVFLDKTQEIPAVMAFRDGKPDKGQALFQAGKYTMPLTKEGIVIVGKSQVRFRRKEK